MLSKYHREGVFKLLNYIAIQKIITLNTKHPIDEEYS